MGNGWCINNEIRKKHGRIGLMDKWLQGVTIQKRSGADAGLPEADAAKACERNCDNDTHCIGYMTEDGSKCQIIPGKEYGSSNVKLITGVDTEKKNFCWLWP